MPEDWKKLPLDQPLFANLDPDAVVGFNTAIENGFINELKGHTRMPGLRDFVEFGGRDRIYLHEYQGDLVAGTSKGKVFRITRNGTASDVTAVPVAGGRRIVFAQTDQALLMAAGGPIVRLRDRTTEVLSRSAPNSTHVGWLDNFTLAVELNSGRFFQSGAGAPDQWDPLDSFAADGNPDNINSLLVTNFREVMLGGEDSTEQFERSPTGDVPFFRRWSISDGVKLPYVMLFADNAMWTINQLTEFVRCSGQSSQSAGDTIGRLLESVDDWTDAWLGGYPSSPLHVLGQKFMILQAPHATNSYGTKGLTLLYDYRKKQFQSTLYGWDAANGVPTRWPGWSHWRIWDRVFVGGEGKIYEMTDQTYRHGSDVQRWLVRTSHMAPGSGIVVNGFRLQVKRGIGTSATAPNIRVRCSRDSKPMGPWITRSMGKAGQRLQMLEFGSFGSGSTFQWEISTSDDCAVDLLKAEIKASPIGH